MKKVTTALMLIFFGASSAFAQDVVDLDSEAGIENEEAVEEVGAEEEEESEEEDSEEEESSEEAAEAEPSEQDVAVLGLDDAENETETPAADATPKDPNNLTPEEIEKLSPAERTAMGLNAFGPVSKPKLGGVVLGYSFSTSLTESAFVGEYTNFGDLSMRVGLGASYGVTKKERISVNWGLGQSLKTGAANAQAGAPVLNLDNLRFAISSFRIPSIEITERVKLNFSTSASITLPTSIPATVNPFYGRYGLSVGTNLSAYGFFVSVGGSLSYTPFVYVENGALAKVTNGDVIASRNPGEVNDATASIVAASELAGINRPLSLGANLGLGYSWKSLSFNAGMGVSSSRIYEEYRGEGSGWSPFANWYVGAGYSFHQLANVNLGYSHGTAWTNPNNADAAFGAATFFGTRFDQGGQSNFTLSISGSFS